MDAVITPVERNRAHARVGVGAGAAFLALLLVLLATRGPAAADPGLPATTPAPTVQPQQTQPDPGFRPRREGGFGRRDGGGGPGFGPGGGQSIPAPDDGGQPTPGGTTT
jgi:hypothetical protein